MANKDFRLTAVLAVRDTMSPVLAVASQKWEGFKTAIDSTEFNDLNRKLKLAQRSVQDFASEAQGVAQAVGAPFAAVAGAVGFSLQSAVTGFAQAGDGLDKMSARLGISAVKLQEWSFAATHAGAAPEDLEDALKDLSEKIAEVAGGDTGDAAQLFSALGISVKDASGKIRPASDIFEEVADAIQRNEDPALRTKMAMVLMGDSGRKLIPMLSGGAQGLDDMAKQAHDLGLVMNEDAVAAAAKMTDHMDDMKASVTAVGHEIGYRLSPIVISMSDRFRDLAAANKGALGEKVEKVAGSFADAIGKIDFEGIASAILTIADYSVRAFNAIGGFNTVLYGMGALIAGKSIMAVVSLGSSVIGLVQSFGAVASAAKAFGIVATTSMGPIGWVLGALAVGAGIIIANWDRIGPALKEVVGSVVDFVPGAFDVCKEKFGAVAGAILTTATGLFRGDFKTLFGGLDDLATASFNLLPGAWGKAAVSWYESVKASVSRIGQMIKDFFANFDFKSLMPNMDDMIPSGVKSFFGFGVDKDDDPNPKAARMERSAGFANPVSMEPDRSARMSGEMVVRVAASPGTTAQLADMSADGMKLTGNVGYSDRYAEEDSF
jgi:hypothetical protein